MIVSIEVNSSQWKEAMTMANRAYNQDKTTFPNKIRKDPAVLKVLSMIRNKK